MDRQRDIHDIYEIGRSTLQPLGRAVGVRPTTSGRAATKGRVLYSTSTRQASGRRSQEQHRGRVKAVLCAVCDRWWS